MMYFKKIDQSSFKNSISKQKNDLKWFYDIINVKITENKFYIIKFNGKDVGLLVQYYSLSAFEYGILINSDFKNIGLGACVVTKLIKISNGLARFTVNYKNLNALSFFNKLKEKKIISNKNINLLDR